MLKNISTRNFFKTLSLYHILILLGIIVVGIFFRTYQFHEWLHFGSDQSRDAFVVQGAATGETAWPLLGPDASNTHFKLGPMYYYFQIISVKLFGIHDDAMAYPDLFFSILAIPLFFVFLKRYFSTGLSLSLTGLYAISFYVIEYSRFAWNPNPIPFFIMLFLLALSEFFFRKKETSWWWIVLLGGIAGIGIQLHTLLLLILPAMLAGSLIFCIVRGCFDWKQWAIIFLIAVMCNIGQIRNEIETGGRNLAYFSAALTDRSGSGGGRLFQNLGLNVLCHAQASAHILSSWGGSGGTCEYVPLLSYSRKSGGLWAYRATVSMIVLSIVFVAIGYGLLGYAAWKEQDERKKYFLGTILVYVAVSFLVMLSIIRGAPLRYFIHVEFVPFVLLGLVLKTAMEKIPRLYVISVMVVIFGSFLVTNVTALVSEARQLSDGTRGDSGFVVLGQAERMVAYMEAQSGDTHQAYLWGKDQYVSTYYKSLKYIALQGHFDLVGVSRKEKPRTAGMPIFYISKSDPKKIETIVNGYEVETYKNFGQLVVYRLKN